MSHPLSLPKKIHIIGASGRSGKALVKELAPYDCEIVAIIRNKEKWQKTKLPYENYVINLDEPYDFPSLQKALSDATHIVNTAHARYAPILLKAGPENASYVFLGSTRKFTQWPDSHGNGVLAGEQAFLQSNRSGIMLHPTMIYGAEGENNVQRLANLLKRLPIIPLPNGGKFLVQPIYQSDVIKSILIALSKNWQGPHTLIIAGKSAITYREFIQLILKTAHIRPKPIISMPTNLLKIIAMMTRIIPKIPTIESAEIQRLIENKNFDITEMENELGFIPMDFSTGIQQTQFK